MSVLGVRARYRNQSLGPLVCDKYCVHSGESYRIVSGRGGSSKPDKTWAGHYVGLVLYELE